MRINKRPPPPPPLSRKRIPRLWPAFFLLICFQGSVPAGVSLVPAQPAMSTQPATQNQLGKTKCFLCSGTQSWIGEHFVSFDITRLQHARICSIFSVFGEPWGPWEPPEKNKYSEHPGSPRVRAKGSQGPPGQHVNKSISPLRAYRLLKGPYAL